MSKRRPPRKRLKAFTEMAEAEGLEVLGFERTGTTHIKAQLKYRGRTFFHIIASSPSDRRAELNQRSDLRRKIREYTQ